MAETAAQRGVLGTMTIETAITFALALLVWVLIPGPAILSVVGRSMATGFRPALNLIVGVLLGALTAYAYAASRARQFFRDRRKMRILNRSAGTILIGAGIAVATKR